MWYFLELLKVPFGYSFLFLRCWHVLLFVVFSNRVSYGYFSLCKVIPGSGKSYEVVSSVILEHFKKGRRIVSNIVGLTQSKLFDYCVSRVQTPDLGEFIQFSE